MSANNPNSSAAVPKFTSFKPKAAPFPAKHATELSERRRTGRDERHDRDHRESRQASQIHEEVKRYTKKRREPPVRDSVNYGLEDTHELFKVDRRGDDQIPRYGSLHHYSIPQYRRTGYGSVLGLPRGMKIDGDASTQREIVIVDGEYSSLAKRKRPILSNQAPMEGRPLRMVAGEKSDTNLDQEYIPIPSRKRKRRSESPVADEVDYRSIEGKAKRGAQSPEDPDAMYESDTMETSQEVSEALKRNSELSRRTQLEPRDVNTWLDLIDHQEVVVGGSEGLTSSTRRTLADIRLSIYEQALKQIRTNQKDRVRLLLGYLDEASAIWDSRRLATRWSEALQAHPNSVKMWTSYINFIQTSFTNFRYEPCRSMFRDCLSVLQAAVKQSEADRATLEELHSIIVYILLRLTMYMEEAGYQEHAAATWQAVLEYHLCRPKELVDAFQNAIEDSKRSAYLQAFEEFWESEVARIGEPQSLGWAHCYGNGGSAPEPTSVTLDTPISPDDCFHDFAQAEEQLATALHLPGRTIDEVEEDDPYHIVLFSDIKDILSLLPLDLSDLTLVQAYLCFSGLPPFYHSNDTTASSWWLDPFLRRECLDSKLAVHYKHDSSIPLNGREPGAFATLLTSLSACPMRYGQTTTTRLFGDAFPAELGSDQQREWIRRTLKTIAATAPKNDVLAEYYVAFEWRYFPATAVKAAKALLKAMPSSLRLYNAYALLEARSGRSSAANRVFSTALGMSQSLPQHQQKDAILLWRTWIWESLRSSASGTAARRVLEIGNGTPSTEFKDERLPEFSPAAVLKAKRTLTEGRDHMLTARDSHVVLFTECLALLAYFQRPNDIGAALDVFHETSALLKPRSLFSSPLSEQIHEAQAQLLVFHVTHTHSYKPSLLRTELADSIMLFPNNTALLATYAANEARFRLDDRVRTIMRDLVLKEKQDTVVGWSFAIWSELSKSTDMGGTLHSVRAVFERAVDSKSGRHSIALWHSYVLFEHAHGDRQRARSVFFRGLTNLPWAKQYMMLAFSHLREALSVEDLKRIYNVLREKELRVYVDLEDTIEEAERRRAGDLVRLQRDGELDLPNDDDSGVGN